MILATFLVCFWPIIGPGQEWAKIGPGLGQILEQDCAGYGLLSVRDWDGLRLGQNWDGVGLETEQNMPWIRTHSKPYPGHISILIIFCGGSELI